MLQQDGGRLALVTGASRGIGAEIARRLDQMGFQVLLTGRDENRLKEVSKTLANKSFIKTVDLENEESVHDLCEHTKSICSGNKLHLKVLINNAGIYQPEPFDAVDLKGAKKQFQVNCFAPMQLALGLGSLLKASQGVVVNISSTLGNKPVANTSIYSASKAAMNNWTQSLALEWAKDQVRVIGICPGIVDTPIHRFHSEPEKSENRQKAHQAHPLGRLGKPEDIASVVAFAVSEEASWITGSLWNVDGGISLL